MSTAEHRAQIEQVLEKLRDVKKNVDATEDIDVMYRQFSRINPIPRQLFTVERMHNDLNRFIEQHEQALTDLDAQ